MWGWLRVLGKTQQTSMARLTSWLLAFPLQRPTSRWPCTKWARPKKPYGRWGIMSSMVQSTDLISRHVSCSWGSQYFESLPWLVMTIEGAEYSCCPCCAMQAAIWLWAGSCFKHLPDSSNFMSMLLALRVVQVIAAALPWFSRYEGGSNSSFLGGGKWRRSWEQLESYGRSQVCIESTCLTKFDWLPWASMPSFTLELAILGNVMQSFRRICSVLWRQDLLVYLNFTLPWNQHPCNLEIDHTVVRSVLKSWVESPKLRIWTLAKHRYFNVDERLINQSTYLLLGNIILLPLGKLILRAIWQGLLLCCMHIDKTSFMKKSFLPFELVLACRYADIKWLERWRRWPPQIRTDLENFLKIKSSQHSWQCCHWCLYVHERLAVVLQMLKLRDCAFEIVSS